MVRRGSGFRLVEAPPALTTTAPALDSIFHFSHCGYHDIPLLQHVVHRLRRLPFLGGRYVQQFCILYCGFCLPTKPALNAPRVSIVNPNENLLFRASCKLIKHPVSLSGRRILASLLAFLHRTPLWIFNQGVILPFISALVKVTPNLQPLRPTRPYNCLLCLRRLGCPYHTDTDSQHRSPWADQEWPSNHPLLVAFCHPRWISQGTEGEAAALLVRLQDNAEWLYDGSRSHGNSGHPSEQVRRPLQANEWGHHPTVSR